jgi:hypothetical protein
MRILGRRVKEYFIPALIITILSVIGAIIASVFDYPTLNALSGLTFLCGFILTVNSIVKRDEMRMYNVPRSSKSMAHIYSAIIMIVFLGIHFILEEILEFESAMDYWISGFFGVIGVLMVFSTIILTIYIYKENKGLL